jgi:hypothetical protein
VIGPVSTECMITRLCLPWWHLERSRLCQKDIGIGGVSALRLCTSNAHDIKARHVAKLKGMFGPDGHDGLTGHNNAASLEPSLCNAWVILGASAVDSKRKMVESSTMDLIVPGTKEKHA